MPRVEYDEELSFFLLVYKMLRKNMADNVRLRSQAKDDHD